MKITSQTYHLSQQLFPNTSVDECSSIYPTYTPIGAVNITIEVVTCDC